MHTVLCRCPGNIAHGYRRNQLRRWRLNIFPCCFGLSVPTWIEFDSVRIAAVIRIGHSSFIFADFCRRHEGICEWSFACLGRFASAKEPLMPTEWEAGYVTEPIWTLWWSQQHLRAVEWSMLPRLDPVRSVVTSKHAVLVNSSPHRPDRLWDHSSLLLNGYRGGRDSGYSPHIRVCLLIAWFLHVYLKCRVCTSLSTVKLTEWLFDAVVPLCIV